ncbi:hypothetical protein WN943_013145 [Citrus x changshan-huyou]
MNFTILAIAWCYLQVPSYKQHRSLNLGGDLAGVHLRGKHHFSNDTTDSIFPQLKRQHFNPLPSDTT